MKKPYEIHLTKEEYDRFRKLMILTERILQIYAEHPDMDIIVKVKPKRLWPWARK